MNEQHMILSYKEINQLKKRLKGKKFSFTSGCFDLLHKGHIQMIQHSKKPDMPLVVGIFPDEYVKERKGKDRPVHTQKDRAALIDALKSVDYVLLLTSEVVEGKLPVGAVRDLQPTVYVTRSMQWKKYLSEMQDIGVRVEMLKTKQISSTTQILDKIKKKHY